MEPACSAPAIPAAVLVVPLVVVPPAVEFVVRVKLAPPSGEVEVASVVALDLGAPAIPPLACVVLRAPPFERMDPATLLLVVLEPSWLVNERGTPPVA